MTPNSPAPSFSIAPAAPTSPKEPVADKTHSKLDRFKFFKQILEAYDKLESPNDRQWVIKELMEKDNEIERARLAADPLIRAFTHPKGLLGDLADRGKITQEEAAPLKDTDPLS